MFMGGGNSDLAADVNRLGDFLYSDLEVSQFGSIPIWQLMSADLEVPQFSDLEADLEVSQFSETFGS